MPSTSLFPPLSSACAPARIPDSEVLLRYLRSFVFNSRGEVSPCNCCCATSLLQYVYPFISSYSLLTCIVSQNSSMKAELNGEDTLREAPPHCQPASSRQTQLDEAALTVTRVEQAHISSFLRTNIQQEALLSSHALYQTQVALNDPSGRIRQRLLMLLRYSAWAEEHEFYAVPLLYSQLVSLLPRLPFLGQSLVQRILSLRRVNAAAARAGLAPSAGSAFSLPLDSEHRLTHEDPAKRGLCEDIESDWVQRRHEAQELESLVQDIQTAHSPGWRLQYSLPASLDEMATILRTHNSCFIYCLFAEDYCNIALFDRDCVESGPRTLRFPDFTLARRNQIMARLNVACTVSRAARDNVQRKIRFVGPQRQTETVEQILAELWTALVQPILAGFDIQVKSLIDYSLHLLTICPG
jgi:hypothetical protein